MLRSRSWLRSPTGWLLLTLALINWHAPAVAQSSRLASGKRGAVVSVSPEATDVGLAVLKRGGNAVDAAVAVAFALAVTFPEAGNIGGGGFMMVLPGPGQEPVCIDYRETAPAAATEDMFQIGDSRFGHKIVGVPGTVGGLARAHREYGVLPWQDLVTPAIELARQGFPVQQPLADSLNRLLRDPESRPFVELQRLFRPPVGHSWKPGDSLVQAELAATLQQIAEHGADAFYRGNIARQIVAEVHSAEQGLITAADLRNYRARKRQPIHCRYKGFDIYGPPPPSSGGICLALLFNMAQSAPFEPGSRWSPNTVHRLLEMMRRAYLERARNLGDADFVRIPARLTRPQYARRLAAGIDPRKATPSDSLAPDIPLADEGSQTTHFSVVDRQGMAVANTYTLEYAYGSRVVVKGAGFLLNNEMGDFNWKPGYTNRSGTIGTDPNLIRPGKRMLSSQCPTLVTREGRAFLVTGSPGGRTIINTVFQVVLNVVEFEMDLPAAVATPRLHHQWLPDEFRFEGRAKPRYQPLLKELEARGHQLSGRRGRQGDAHTIRVDPLTGTIEAVADDRRHGKAAAW